VPCVIGSVLLYQVAHDQDDDPSAAAEANKHHADDAKVGDSRVCGRLSACPYKLNTRRAPLLSLFSSPLRAHLARRLPSLTSPRSWPT
jgi:hypothetical protein